MSKLHVKKGDNVIVIAGNDKSDKPRRVLEVYPDKQRVLVEEVNMVSKATKPNAQNPQGGIVMLVDPKDGKRTRIQRVKNEEGKLVRIAVRSKEVIK